MFLVLLRHGLAEPKGTKPDEERELTDTGHRRMKKIARQLAEWFDCEAIHSSPLVRAMQTAEWVASAYDNRLRIHELASLRPGSNPRELDEFLAGVKEKRIILVGHEPHLSATMLHLTGMSGDIELKKGGCYGIRIENGGGALEWMLPPRFLRA